MVASLLTPNAIQTKRPLQPIFEVYPQALVARQPPSEGKENDPVAETMVGYASAVHNRSRYEELVGRVR